MENGANEAQMITRVVLAGSVFVIKLTGSGTMQMARFLSAVANGELSTSGQMNLKSMLKTGKRLKVFSVRGEENFKAFAVGAREYGIKYAVVKRTDEDRSKELYEIMVFEDDAAKINRVIEKYNLMELRDSGETAENVEMPEEQQMSIGDVRGLLAQMMESDQETEDTPVNFMQVSERENLSDTQSSYLEDDVSGQMFERIPGAPMEERQSVRAEIEEISENTGTDNTLGNNPGLLTQMMMPEDADEKDKLNYGINIIQEAVGNAFENVLKQTGGDATYADSGS